MTELLSERERELRRRLLIISNMGMARMVAEIVSKQQRWNFACPCEQEWFVIGLAGCIESGILP